MCLKQGVWQTQSISHDCLATDCIPESITCWCTSLLPCWFSLGGSILDQFLFIMLCLFPSNFWSVWYFMRMSMSFSSTSTGRNAGCAREPLHYPCQRLWEGLQESHQKGWPRTWLLQVVNQLFMPSPYLLLLHCTIIIVRLIPSQLIALIKAAMFDVLVNWWIQTKKTNKLYSSFEPMSSVIYTWCCHCCKRLPRKMNTTQFASIHFPNMQ